VLSLLLRVLVANCLDTVELIFELLDFLFVFVVGSLNSVSVLVGNLEIVHVLLLLFVSRFQLVILLLVGLDRNEQLSIGLLFVHELFDEETHVGVASLRTDLLESQLDWSVLLHLFLHAALKELGPELLDEECVPFHLLLSISVLISRLLGNLNLSILPLDSLLESFLLVLDRVLEGDDTLASFLLLVVDNVDQILKLLSGLKLLLPRAHLLGTLLSVDVVLAAQTIRAVVDFQSQGDEISLHTIKHVLVRAFRHPLVVVCLPDVLQFQLGKLGRTVIFTSVFRHSVISLLSLGYLFLEEPELTLLLDYLLMGLII